LKKPAGSVWFRFYKKKPNQTETEKNWKKNRAKPEKPSQNRKKPSQNRENRAKPVWTGFFPKNPNRTETGRFDPVSVYLKKKFGLVTFFDKNQTEPKMITPNINWFNAWAEMVFLSFFLFLFFLSDLCVGYVENQTSPLIFFSFNSISLLLFAFF